MMFQMFLFASLALNFCKNYDILATMNDPFFPASRRMKFYLLFTVVFMFAPFLTIGAGFAADNCRLEEDPDNCRVFHTIFESCFTVLLISGFYIYAIYSGVHSLRLTTRPGISREMRKNFAYQHMKYMAIYSCSWLFYYFASYYLMFYTALFGKKF
jgi:hypothetical protein